MLRVGIAGLGFGSGVHLPVFRSIPGVEVTALLGRQPNRVRATAENFSVPGAYTSLDAFLDRPLDAVVIALPPESAGAVASAALERDLAILGEKPIAATAAEAAILAEQSRNTTTMVDFEFHGLATFQALKAMLAGGELGKISGVNVTWRTMSYAHKRQVWSWKTDAAAGGGVLTLNGLHLFDLLEWLFGPVNVTGVQLSDEATRAFAPPGKKPAPDTADLTFLTATASVIRVHLSNAATDRHGHRWEIETGAGRIVLDDGGNGAFSGFTLTQQTLKEHRVLACDPDIEGDYRIAPVRALAERFVAAVRHKTPVAPAFDDGARAQAVQERVYALA
ncbi:MAG: Gfo/Idh/MocA family oxidoreductase [Proteobacteria bacterium]|nr:Gfo/Idh/MocA family oxidoreductase [Pseudomonadota bacterium]MDA1308259.1 Gfo/Idh/MocA family oxidoreductase [Pseudomonadota bacterium]